MRSLECTLIHMTGDLIRRGKFGDRNSQGERHVKMEAEVGAMHPQARNTKDRWNHQDLRQRQLANSPSEPPNTLLTPQCQSFGLENKEKINFGSFKPLSLC